ncbi:alpha/beta fold hydrolase [Fodinibius halophilus]|uniref:Alpha/beta hydrolase n=1 Tax=Fodinibius halophilus TaxID=1736908 RepID=A0A6M1T1G5_9BACT|nr:alpha/beta hydrolase [Fodinibius halophilus]NGP89918.1 alpha/beta hydrolase [Fodinibius halophilus]
MCTDLNFSLDEIAVKKVLNYPNRPTLVFLHDSLGCIELWRDFPEKVAERTECNLIIYDRQGYGQSPPFSYSKRDNNYMELEADILHELLDFWDIDDAILFGHSDGGSIALMAAAKYPESILGIITEGAHIFVEDITISGIKEVIKRYEKTDLKKKLAKYHGDKTDDMFWAWADTWTSDRFKKWNIEDFLPSVTCPSMIIQGNEDQFGSLEQVHTIVNQTSGRSEELVIPETKHTPHKKRPELVLSESAKFIQELVEYS